MQVDEEGDGGAGGGDDDVATEEVCTKMLQQVLEQAENFSGVRAYVEKQTSGDYESEEPVCV